jgi:hypothetical protein
MKEISLFDLEENFDEIMNQVYEHNEKYLIRTPDGAGVVLTSSKEGAIDELEEKGRINELNLDNI